jgi:hypothetical protein
MAPPSVPPTPRSEVIEEGVDWSAAGYESDGSSVAGHHYSVVSSPSVYASAAGRHSIVSHTRRSIVESVVSKSSVAGSASRLGPIFDGPDGDDELVDGSVVQETIYGMGTPVLAAPPFCDGVGIDGDGDGDDDGDGDGGSYTASRHVRSQPSRASVAASVGTYESAMQRKRDMAARRADAQWLFVYDPLCTDRLFATHWVHKPSGQSFWERPDIELKRRWAYITQVRNDFRARARAEAARLAAEMEARRVVEEAARLRAEEAARVAAEAEEALLKEKGWGARLARGRRLVSSSALPTSSEPLTDSGGVASARRAPLIALAASAESAESVSFAEGAADVDLAEGDEEDYDDGDSDGEEEVEAGGSADGAAGGAADGAADGDLAAADSGGDAVDGGGAITEAEAPAPVAPAPAPLALLFGKPVEPEPEPEPEEPEVKLGFASQRKFRGERRQGPAVPVIHAPPPPKSKVKKIGRKKKA